MRGVFLDSATVDQQDLDLDALKSSLPDWSVRTTTRIDEVGQAIQGADIVISNKVRLERKTFQSANTLKLICVAATGTNNVDLAAAAAHGITVCNVRGYATTSVVEHVFSLILALTRHLHDYRTAVKQGKWRNAESFCLLDYPVRELAGQTLGIIGYGELGSAVATMGKAFGMTILVAQRPGGVSRTGRTPLNRLLSQSDIISLHCPLTDMTRNLIDCSELSLMKRGALLINTARGGIVNETALKNALQSGQIAGAAIDVLSEEPPRNGNPLLDEPIPNLIITPHIAWASINARQLLINELTENIHAFLKGKPRNVVHA
ncbi:MAG: 2-hydroxyacid dehydrogenase [Pseudomonadota bacterium]